MKQRDWIALAVIGAGLYVLYLKFKTVPGAVAIAPGVPGPSGGILTLPPGVPSGQANVNAALGYDANGNLLPLSASDALNAALGLSPSPATTPLPSTAIGSGWMDLIPAGGGNTSLIDAALADPGIDYGFAPVGLDANYQPTTDPALVLYDLNGNYLPPLGSTQTVPYYA